jgi:surface polysaccharide O-acyltransferase-like enzyme
MDYKDGTLTRASRGEPVGTGGEPQKLRTGGGFKERIVNLDALRVIAICAVVAGHCFGFDIYGLGVPGPTAKLLGLAPPATHLNEYIEYAVFMGARWTMPFFFLIAGYFVGAQMLARPEDATRVAWRHTKRLLWVFVPWCVVYAAARVIFAGGHLSAALGWPMVLPFPGHGLVALVLWGTEGHLWFLPALASALWLFALAPARMRGWPFLALAFGLFVFGVLGGAYRRTPIGIEVEFPTLVGPFMSTLFFAMGALYRHHQMRINVWLAGAMAVLGLLAYTAETRILQMYWSEPAIFVDYAFSSILYGVGVTLFAMQLPTLELARRVAAYAPYVIGIYASHFLFLNLLNPFGIYFPPLIWEAVFPTSVFLLSLGTVAAVPAAVRWLRPAEREVGPEARTRVRHTS